MFLNFLKNIIFKKDQEAFFKHYAQLIVIIFVNEVEKE